MDRKMERQYGLITAIAMVVGTVIGSGVFFKAEKILSATGGNLPLGIFAWLIGGLIMVICSYAFSIMATKYEHVNGIVDYADVAVGKGYGYLVGWFMAAIYYPTLTSVLAWVTARYICVILGFSIVGAECMVMAGALLILNYTINALSPSVAGKLQVSATVIKMVPLLLMAVVGTVVGLISGMTIENFTTIVTEVNTGNALFTAIVATAFAYEGWIVATSINAELKDAKKNLPRALVIGSLIVIGVYILYYVGLAGGITNAEMMQGGEAGAKIAFESVFSRVGGSALFAFVIVSCFGTLNGLMVGCTRGMYSLAARNLGPKPHMFGQIDPATKMPSNSSIVGLLLCAFWLVYFYGANLADPTWFGKLSFDSSELPIVTIYAAYIPIMLLFMKKEKELSPFKRFVAPALGALSSAFMIVAAIFAHGEAVAWYLVIFAVIMVIGAFFYRPQKAAGK